MMNFAKIDTTQAALPSRPVFVNTSGQADLFELGGATQGEIPALALAGPIPADLILAAINDAGLNKSEMLMTYVFLTGFRHGRHVLHFSLDDLETAAQKLGAKLPKNVPDVVYAVQRKEHFPDLIVQTAPEGMEWQIETISGGNYCFLLQKICRIAPDRDLSPHRLKNEAAHFTKTFDLTAKGRLELEFRLNGLLDHFLGRETSLVCQPPRGNVKSNNRIDFNAIYASDDGCGLTKIIPVLIEPAAKELNGFKLFLSVRDVEIAFPEAPALPLIVQRLENGCIAIMMIEIQGEGVRVVREEHYQLC